MTNNLPVNLKLLASYGKSISDICRKANINRQQFNKYVNGHSEPSIATLRKICDFFGVDEGEVFLPADEFKKLLLVRPPKLGQAEGQFEKTVSNLLNASNKNTDLLKRHEGFYFCYTQVDGIEKRVIKTLSRISMLQDQWYVKSIERGMNDSFMLPATVKYKGLITESSNRLIAQERQTHNGKSFHTTFLYPADHGEPTYLTGLQMGIVSESGQEIVCIRTIWQYLGLKPNLREVLRELGVFNLADIQLPEFIRQGIDNRMQESDETFAPKY